MCTFFFFFGTEIKYTTLPAHYFYFARCLVYPGVCSNSLRNIIIALHRGVQLEIFKRASKRHTYTLHYKQTLLLLGAQRAILFIQFQVNHIRGPVVDLQEELTVLLLIPLISIQGFPLGNQVQQAFESEDFLT